MNTALTRRAAGAVLLVACVLLWGGESAWWVTIGLWVGFATAAYLLTGEFFAIAFTVFMLALVQILYGIEPRWLYGSIGLASGLFTGLVLTKRFKQRMDNTREERWRHR